MVWFLNAKIQWFCFLNISQNSYGSGHMEMFRGLQALITGLFPAAIHTTLLKPLRKNTTSDKNVYVTSAREGGFILCQKLDPRGLTEWAQTKLTKILRKSQLRAGHHPAPGWQPYAIRELNCKFLHYSLKMKGVACTQSKWWLNWKLD